MRTLILTVVVASATRAENVPTAASWIWYPESVATEGVDQTRYLRRLVRLDERPVEARLRVLADDSYTFTINGRPAPPPVEHGRAGDVYILTNAFTEGENVLAFSVHNAVGKGGLILRGSVREVGGRELRLWSDTSFKAAREPAEGWDRPGFDDSPWPEATIVGSAFAAPWYGHPAFDLEPFLEPSDRERWAAWREPLIALPKGLEQEQPAHARFEHRQGSCALVINGRPRPPFIYRGTVDPLSEHGRRQIALFRDVGVHVYAAYVRFEDFWQGADRSNLATVDDHIRAYLSVDPQAYLILLGTLVPPRWWMEAHPEELVRYAQGEDYNSSDECGRVARPSLASQVWRDEALAMWRAALMHLEGQPWGKRIIGYHPCFGIYGEWHYYGSWTEQMPDTGPAMRAYFRQWLRSRYGTVERLQEAWGDPRVTFETVEVPQVEPRLAAGALGLRHPREGRWVMDYYRCQQEVTANDVELFCAAAKEITGGRTLCGAFYGYWHGVPPQTQGGHLEIARLLRSPHIDYFAAPYDYGHRLIGDDGRGRALCDAFPLAGKVHMIEADTRTHLHPLNEHGRVGTREESIAAIRREVATALLHGSALWWCDFGADGSGGWYDDPSLIKEVAQLYQLAEERLRRPLRRTAEVALICDPQSCYLLGDGAAMRIHYRSLDEVTTALYRTGAPFDQILLSQLPQADLQRYRLLIFLNTLNVEPEMRQVIQQICPDKSVLWLGAPGVMDGKNFGTTLVTDLTGFRVALEREGLPATVVRCREDHPLTELLPTSSVWQLTPQEVLPIAEALDAARWYNPRDTKTMAEQYARFDWRIDRDLFRWDFATTASWTDIHLEAKIPECEGLGLEVSGEGVGDGLSMRVVLKGHDAAEFVSPSFRVATTPQTYVIPCASFTKAPWDRSGARQLTFPLRGLKIVLDGITSNRPGALLLRNLVAMRGPVTEHAERGYGDPVHPTLVLTIDDPQAVVLGHDPATNAVLLACKGEAGKRQVLSTVPFVPRQLLMALMDEAGVCRYVDSPEVVVRADSDMISLHTKIGGRYELRLPQAATVRDALTGQHIGRGRRLSVDLPPNSTKLLAIRGQ
ncbi:MAG: beta-galactosidase [Candidatus Zipacnadales bacterium]